MFCRRICGLLVLIFPGLSVISCSIKDSRLDCPCYVNVNVDAFCSLNGADAALVSVMSGSPVTKENISLMDYAGTGYDVVVDRKTNSFSCVIGNEGMICTGDSIICPANGEWGRIYADAKSVFCDADDRYVELVPHKDFCTVTFVLVGVDSVEDYPFDIRVRANSNGMRVKDRKPVEGKYVAYAAANGSGTTLSVRLPRQSDTETVMDFMNRRQDRIYSVDDRVKTILLGKIMEAGGYNWEKDDLEDLSVTIDYVRASVSVRIDEWEEVYYEEGI